MKKFKFPALVVDEAKNLRKHTTPKEKENLDFENLSTNSISGCVYGQLTGDCYSSRASELIMKCAKRVYITTTGINGFAKRPGESKKLNGRPKETRNMFQGKYWSPIEVFIDRATTPPEANEYLLNFIKGKRRSI